MAISSTSSNTASSPYTALTKANDPYAQLIDNLITLDSTTKNNYLNQKQTQQDRKTAISSIGTDLSSLNSMLNDYLLGITNQFNPMAATSSDTNAFTATADNTVQSKGNYTINIQNTAHNDIRYSNQFTATGTDFVGQLSSASSPGSFTLNVAGQALTVQAGDLTGMNNKDALTAVASAINSAASDYVSATIVQETSDTVRLEIRSKDSGQANQMTFQNTAGAGNPAEILGLTLGSGSGSEGQNNTAILSGTSAGSVYATSDLDAHFTIDGLSYSRSSNKVTDAIPGMTLNLTAPTNGDATISVASDTKQSQSAVQKFIDAYNKLNSDVRSKSSLNSKTGQRGPLGNDRTFQDLMYSLRNSMISPVSSLTGSHTDIFSIGLDFQQDGTLYIADQTKLDDALKNDPESVQKLFTTDSGNTTVGSADGLAKRLQSQIDSYVKAGGIIDNLKSSIDSRINQLDTQINQQNDYLAMKRQQYQKQFQQLQVIANRANVQFNTLSSMFSSSSTNSTGG